MTQHWPHDPREASAGRPWMFWEILDHYFQILVLIMFGMRMMKMIRQLSPILDGAWNVFELFGFLGPFKNGPVSNSDGFERTNFEQRPFRTATFSNSDLFEQSSGGFEQRHSRMVHFRTVHFRTGHFRTDPTTPDFKPGSSWEITST